MRRAESKCSSGDLSIVVVVGCLYRLLACLPMILSFRLVLIRLVVAVDVRLLTYKSGKLEPVLLD